MDKRLQQLKREMASDNNPVAAQRYWHARIQAGERVLLGLSTSFCIQSVLKGHVDLDEIAQIIGSTTGFVENGKPGEHYEEIVDRYMKSYWYEYSRQNVEEVIISILPRMSEQQHGLPGAWVDASRPHYWGWVPHGSHLGIVGDYINVETNKTIYSADDILERMREDHPEERYYNRPRNSKVYRFKVAEIGGEADHLNIKYGFVNQSNMP